MDLIAPSGIAKTLGTVFRIRATEITNEKGFPDSVATMANGRLRI